MQTARLIAEAKNDKTGAAMFDTVKFKEAGVYEYTVSEVNDKQANIKYDEHVYKIKVTVTDDGSGTLSAEVSDDSIVFTNHYTPAGTGTDTGDDSSIGCGPGSDDDGCDSRWSSARKKKDKSVIKF